MVSLPAHLQIVGGILTLNGLKIIQQAHPNPAVADVPMMRFHIEWKELLSRRVVAESISPFYRSSPSSFSAPLPFWRPLSRSAWRMKFLT
jgi:hypothetical protein